MTVLKWRPENLTVSVRVVVGCLLWHWNYQLPALEREACHKVNAIDGEGQCPKAL